MSGEQALIAVTIRKIASDWCGDDTALQAELYELSDRALRVDLSRAACCPICQEVMCDPDCPFDTLRRDESPISFRVWLREVLVSWRDAMWRRAPSDKGDSRPT